jgi:hypothetical protein
MSMAVVVGGAAVTPLAWQAESSAAASKAMGPIAAPVVPPSVRPTTRGFSQMISANSAHSVQTAPPAAPQRIMTMMSSSDWGPDSDVWKIPTARTFWVRKLLEDDFQPSRGPPSETFLQDVRNELTPNPESNHPFGEQYPILNTEIGQYAWRELHYYVDVDKDATPEEIAKAVSDLAQKWLVDPGEEAARQWARERLGGPAQTPESSPDLPPDPLAPPPRAKPSGQAPPETSTTR